MSDTGLRFVVLSLLLLILALPCVERGMAQPFKSDSPQLELARVCHYEGAFSRSDCAAIFHVISKRARVLDYQWFDMLYAYSAMYEEKTKRAREISRYPWGDVPGKGEQFNVQWADQRVYAIVIFLGAVPDPCPDAVHWGGRTDRRPEHFIQVACSPPTANRFYKLARRRRHAVEERPEPQDDQQEHRRAGALWAACAPSYRHRVQHGAA